MKSVSFLICWIAFLFPQPSQAEENKVSLQRAWETGKQYLYRCESTLRTSAPMGANIVNWRQDEYLLSIWPALENGGRRYGIQWSEFAATDTMGGGKVEFDSKNPKTDSKSRLAYQPTWDLFGKGWSYFDAEGNGIGKTGGGWTNGAMADMRMPNPVGALSKRAEVSLFQKITLAENFPKEPVAPGYRWNSEIKAGFLMVGSLETSLTCEFKEVATRNGHTCAVIVFSGTIRRLLREDNATSGRKEPPALLTPVLNGEIWLEVPSGLGISESYTFSCQQPVAGSGHAIKISDAASVELISEKRIDPAEPLPLPLREKPDKLAKNAAATEMEIPEGKFLLQPGSKVDTRYVWSARRSIDDKVEMAAMKGMGTLPPLQGENEQVDEERVVAEGKDGTRHEYRPLRTVDRALNPEGTIKFDSDHILEKGDMEYVAKKEAWESLRQSSQVALKASNGQVTRRWTVDHRAGDKISEFPPPHGNGFELDLLLGGILSATPKSPGDAWPIDYRLDSLFSADNVAFQGESRFVKLETRDGKRLATVEASGAIQHAKGERPAKAGMGVLESGSFEARAIIDVDSNTLVELYLMPIIETSSGMPGMKSKVRSRYKHGCTIKLLSMEPLPSNQ